MYKNEKRRYQENQIRLIKQLKEKDSDTFRVWHNAINDILHNKVEQYDKVANDAHLIRRSDIKGTLKENNCNSFWA